MLPGKEPLLAQLAVDGDNRTENHADRRHIFQIRRRCWSGCTGDCPGIETTLTLAPDGSYALHLKYIDRDSEFDEKGAFTVKENLLTLTPSEGGQPQYYKVEENRLRRLDAEKQPVTGALADNYTLQKTTE